VLVLGASGGQVGLLKTLFTLPYFVLPLAVGVLLDRKPRRPAMLAANAVRGLLVFALPVLAWTRFRTMTDLFVVALLGGFCTVVFDVAYASFIPTLVGRERLGTANSRLQTGYSAAFLAGPGAAGLLVNAFGAANTLVADAVSYLVSFLAIRSVRVPETVGPPAGAQRSVLREAREGVAALFGIPPVRQIALHAAIYNGSFQLIEVAFLLYALRVRAIGPGLFGLAVTVGGIGGLLGALSSARLARRVGYGPAMVTALCLSTAPYFALAAAGGGRTALVVTWSLTFFLGGTGTGIANVVVATVRQGYTPDALMARVGAGYRMMNSGAIPVGAALAGVLVTVVGVRTTLWLAPFGLLASTAPIVLTSFRRIRTLSTVE